MENSITTRITYSDRDQAVIDYFTGAIRYRSEQLVHRLYKENDNNWDYKCEEAFRNDPERCALFNEFLRAYSLMIPQVSLGLEK